MPNHEQLESVLINMLSRQTDDLKKYSAKENANNFYVKKNQLLIDTVKQYVQSVNEWISFQTQENIKLHQEINELIALCRKMSIMLDLAHVSIPVAFVDNWYVNTIEEAHYLTCTNPMAHHWRFNKDKRLYSIIQKNEIFKKSADGEKKI